MERVTGVKVFSTTLARERDTLGEAIGRWLAQNPNLEIVEKAVHLTSDRQFHCLSITLFYRERQGS